eukprot:scaffold23134_cov24-Tisochrysis_lutea.AAC.1
MHRPNLTGGDGFHSAPDVTRNCFPPRATSPAARMASTAARETRAAGQRGCAGRCCRAAGLEDTEESTTRQRKARGERPKEAREGGPRLPHSYSINHGAGHYLSGSPKRRGERGARTLTLHRPQAQGKKKQAFGRRDKEAGGVEGKRVRREEETKLSRERKSGERGEREET